MKVTYESLPKKFEEIKQHLTPGTIDAVNATLPIWEFYGDAEFKPSIDDVIELVNNELPDDEPAPAPKPEPKAEEKPKKEPEPKKNEPKEEKPKDKEMLVWKFNEVGEREAITFVNHLTPIENLVSAVLLNYKHIDVMNETEREKCRNEIKKSGQHYIWNAPSENVSFLVRVDGAAKAPKAEPKAEPKPKKEPKPKAEKPKKEPKAKAEKQPKEKKAKEKKEPEGEPVAKISPEVAIIKRFVNCCKGKNAGNEKGRETARKILAALQKHIEKKEIRKTSQYAKEIMDIQKALLTIVYKKQKADFDKAEFESLEKIAASEYQEAITKLSISFIGLIGKVGVKDNAKNLLEKFEKAEVSGDLVDTMKKALKAYIDGKTTTVETEERSLQGIYGLAGI